MELTAAQQQHGSNGSGNPAAERQSGSMAAAEQQQAGYLVSEAAELLEIPERTLRAWIRQGKVPVLAPQDGGRGVRLSERTLEELRQVKPATWEGERFLRHGSGNAAAEQQHGSSSSADQQHAGGTAAAEQRQCGNAAAEQPEPAALPAFRFYEDILASVERERDQFKGEVEYLRAQLEVRAREIDRHAEAERELRVMLARLEHTNAELAGALVQKALPPAPEVVEQPRRHWWFFGRRG